MSASSVNAKKRQTWRLRLSDFFQPRQLAPTRQHKAAVLDVVAPQLRLRLLKVLDLQPGPCAWTLAARRGRPPFPARGRAHFKGQVTAAARKPCLWRTGVHLLLRVEAGADEAGEAQRSRQRRAAWEPLTMASEHPPTFQSVWRSGTVGSRWMTCSIMPSPFNQYPEGARVRQGGSGSVAGSSEPACKGKGHAKLAFKTEVWARDASEAQNLGIKPALRAGQRGRADSLGPPLHWRQVGRAAGNLPACRQAPLDGVHVVAAYGHVVHRLEPQRGRPPLAVLGELQAGGGGQRHALRVLSVRRPGLPSPRVAARARLAATPMVNASSSFNCPLQTRLWIVHAY